VHTLAVNRDGLRESLGLEVVTSEGGAALPGFMRKLLTVVPNAARDFVATMVRSIFANPTASGSESRRPHRRPTRRPLPRAGGAARGSRP
jgi:transposase-like protein